MTHPQLMSNNIFKGISGVREGYSLKKNQSTKRNSTDQKKRSIKELYPRGQYKKEPENKRKETIQEK